MSRSAENSIPFPSLWLTYSEAGDRFGLTSGQVAARARRARWPTRSRSDTGEAEVEVPGALLAPSVVWARTEPDQELRERVARAVEQVDRTEASRKREKAYIEEREQAKARVAASKPRWWRLGG